MTIPLDFIGPSHLTSTVTALQKHIKGRGDGNDTRLPFDWIWVVLRLQGDIDLNSFLLCTSLSILFCLSASLPSV